MTDTLIHIGTALNRLSHKGSHYRNRCYIAGKISGLPIETYTLYFALASETVKKMELIPVNPVEIFAGKNWSWCKFMLHDLFELSLCRSVYLQHNWKQSKGARIEFVFARILFKRVYFEEIN